MKRTASTGSVDSVENPRTVVQTNMMPPKKALLTEPRLPPEPEPDPTEMFVQEVSLLPQELQTLILF